MKRLLLRFVAARIWHSNRNRAYQSVQPRPVMEFWKEQRKVSWKERNRKKVDSFEIELYKNILLIEKIKEIIRTNT